MVTNRIEHILLPKMIGDIIIIIDRKDNQPYIAEILEILNYADDSQVLKCKVRAASKYMDAWFIAKIDPRKWDIC